MCSKTKTFILFLSFILTTETVFASVNLVLPTEEVRKLLGKTRQNHSQICNNKS